MAEDADVEAVLHPVAAHHAVQSHQEILRSAMKDNQIPDPTIAIKSAAVARPGLPMGNAHKATRHEPSRTIFISSRKTGHGWRSLRT